MVQLYNLTLILIITIGLYLRILCFRSKLSFASSRFFVSQLSNRYSYVYIDTLYNLYRNLRVDLLYTFSCEYL